MTHLDSLNEKQKEAVLQTEGPLLVLAGAGAGKTKMLTHRILHLIKNGVAPRSILAITFTNKAAKEMRERVYKLIHEDHELNLPLAFHQKNSDVPFVSTFHALGVHIIREQSQLLGLTRNFTIFDKQDGRRAAKEAVVKAQLDPKIYDPTKFLGMISREKSNMVTLDKYLANNSGDYMHNILAEVWKHYEAILKNEKALDFDDLLLKTAMLLESNETVRKYYQSIWKYIHVDEYQDTNRVQYKIADILSAESRNICVVGDIDQNIYSWRGADIKNIINFEKDYLGAKIVLLEENYRSTQIILTAANEIIKKNTNRREKNLFTRNGEGSKIKMIMAYDENDEARLIGENIQTIIDSGTNPSEICILYRANFQSRVLEESMLRRSIPYQVLGTKFFERKEIKDIIAYIRAAMNPESLGDLKRIINEPARGLGKVTVLKVMSNQAHELPIATQRKVSDFMSLLREIKEVAERERPSKVVQFILSASGMEEAYEHDGLEGEERLENVRELVTLATKYDAMPQDEGLEKMLEEAALASDQDEIKDNRDAVKLMTIHASKGLEFEYVFISGLEQGLFPHAGHGEKDRDEEEERRLFYVALTRAKKALYLSFANMRTIFGQRQINVQSEFLGDISEDLMDREERPTSQSAKDIFIDF